MKTTLRTSLFLVATLAMQSVGLAQVVTLGNWNVSGSSTFVGDGNNGFTMGDGATGYDNASGALSFFSDQTLAVGETMTFEFQVTIDSLSGSANYERGFRFSLAGPTNGGSVTYAQYTQDMGTNPGGTTQRVGTSAAFFSAGAEQAAGGPPPNASIQIVQGNTINYRLEVEHVSLDTYDFTGFWGVGDPNELSIEATGIVLTNQVFDRATIVTNQGTLPADLQYTITGASVTIVPEPTSFALLASAGLLLAVRRRRS